MSVKVVDTSAIAAILLDESGAGPIRARLEGHDLTAPWLIRYEFANVCVTKARKLPGMRELFFEALLAFDRLSIRLRDVDMARVFMLAHRSGLTSQDASYLWLAKELDAELVTLDAKLQHADAALARN